MALPSNLVPGLLPTEVEFIATSSVEVDVVPLMKIDKVRLLGGVYGPLVPPRPARIPLWLALNLKKRRRCSIICPDWLQYGEWIIALYTRDCAQRCKHEIDNLKKLHREEIMTEAFAPVVLHYIAIAKVLLESAPDDIPQRDEVRAILKSLREARQSKILSGLANVNSEHLNMTNISLGEITELRDFLTTANNHLRSIERAGEADDSNDLSQEESRQFTYSLRDPVTNAKTTYRSGQEVHNTSNTFSEAGAASRNNSNMDLF